MAGVSVTDARDVCRGCPDMGRDKPIDEERECGELKTSNAEIVSHNFFAELKFMVTTWTYIVPFLLNQSGSLLYYLTLSTADMSLAVPVTNSLTMIFTTLTGKICGENIGNRQTYIGMALVAFGVVLCVIDKVR